MLQLSTSTCSTGSEKLFPVVVKLLASSDIIVKKLASWYITQHGHQEDLILLAINTLVKDCVDSNPMVRGLALRTLSSLPDVTLVQYTSQPVVRGLTDSSAYVRRVAVMSCIKIHQLTPDVIHEHDIIDQLYSMVRDPDPIVVTNCLCALQEILKSEDGIVVNKSMAHYLLNRLNIFTDWGLTQVLDLMKKYHPKTEDETLDIMNVVDSYLKHANSAVVIAALGYFLCLVRDMPHLKSEVHTRASGQVLHFISGANPELTFLLLQFVQSILPQHRDIYETNFRSFFCKYNEPLYVKQKKIEMLPMLITDDNVTEILDELSMYCSDITPILSHDAINALGQVATRSNEYFKVCVQKLLSLLDLHVDYVTCNVLSVFQGLDFRTHGCLQEMIDVLPKVTDQVVDDDGRSAILWLLGEYGEHLADSPYMLEEYIDGVADESSIQLRLHLLTASVKMLLKCPAECQEMVGHLFEVCMHSEDIDVRDRASFYYHLLQTDCQLAKSIICGSH